MKESPGPLRTFPELSGCPESALLHGSGLFLSFCHGGYRVAGVPLRCPAGACPLGRSSVLPLVLILPPIPPPPSPSGKGVPKSLFRRGLRPRHPGTEPPTALTDPSIQVPCGKLAFLRHGFPPPRQSPKTRFPTGNASAAPHPAPCIRKPKNSPFPGGEERSASAGGGMGATKQAKGRVGEQPKRQAPHRAPVRQGL